MCAAIAVFAVGCLDSDGDDGRRGMGPCPEIDPCDEPVRGKPERVEQGLTCDGPVIWTEPVTNLSLTRESAAGAHTGLVIARSFGGVPLCLFEVGFADATGGGRFTLLTEPVLDGVTEDDLCPALPHRLARGPDACVLQVALVEGGASSEAALEFHSNDPVIPLHRIWLTADAE